MLHTKKVFFGELPRIQIGYSIIFLGHCILVFLCIVMNLDRYLINDVNQNRLYNVFFCEKLPQLQISSSQKWPWLTLVGPVWPRSGSRTIKDFQTRTFLNRTSIDSRKILILENLIFSYAVKTNIYILYIVMVTLIVSELLLWSINVFYL